MATPTPPRARPGSAREVLVVAARLGFTSFGGPIAHLGYFRDEYVARRHWVDDATYAHLVALAQLLPGPSSSQVGIAIGSLRAGVLGGLAAWIGFTLPSAVALVLFALLTTSTDVAASGWLHGLMLVAAGVVAQAVLSMARTLTPDGPRRLVAMAGAVASILWVAPLAPVVIIGAGALVGLAAFRRPAPVPSTMADGDGPTAVPWPPLGRRAAVVALTAYLLLLIGLPVAREVTGSQSVAVADAFYRAGALVFGGGHVILPLLHDSVVSTGWVADGRFLAGYGAAQAIPGPLLTFAAYLGTVMIPSPNGLAGASLALVSIFLPSFLLVFGILPFWTALRHAPRAMAALAGANAVVVGVLLAALWSPILSTSVHGPVDLLLVAGAFGLLVGPRLPPWIVVVAGAVAGQVLRAAGWA